MSDEYNERNMRRRREDEDEGWVYPDRMPTRPPARAPGQRPQMYGYDARGESRRQVQSASRNRPAAPQQRGAPRPGYGGISPYPPRQGQRRAAPPQRGAQQRPVPPRGAAQGGAPADRYVPRGAAPGSAPPQRTRSAAAQGASGARRAPRPFDTDGRGMYFSPPERKNRKPLIIAIIVALIVLIAVLVIVPKIGKAAAPPETEPATVQTEPETEPPEPERPVYSYAERTAATKELGDEISCRNAILIDLESNTVIAEKGGDGKIFPASMTKVMTALTAIDKCEDLGDTFTMTNEIVAPLFQANATSAGFAPGEVITVRDLLYGAILPSGADGTGGLAEYTSGTEAEFAGAMNEKCAELGLKNTHFSNASGLHADDHYSTCHDIAIIMEAAMDNEETASALGSAEYVTTKTPEHPDGIELHHTLLYERLDGSEEFDGKIEVIGGKTGYTDEAGNCLVTMARVVSTGKKYVFVCAGGDGKWAPVFDTIHVYRNYLGEHYDGEFVPKSQRTE